MQAENTEEKNASIAIGFDHNKYLEEQSKYILERVDATKDKLYLEFGGKIICDYHASRVLPGFAPTVKIQLLQKLKDKAEIILCIYAGDIERKKVRADFGITYDVDALRMIDELRSRELDLAGVVITRFQNQPSASIFKKKLEQRGIKVYTHPFTQGYPTNIDLIVSDEGYGAHEYIKTSKPLVIVTGPGPGSGKLATCLSQLYHDHKNGLSSGYSKFETFPIWNIPLKHPVNIAYEAATVDLKDVNMVDPYHLEAYKEVTINYNRDIEAFPLLQRILKRVMDKDKIYKSPTDMGVNRAGFSIFDDEITQEAAKQEIIRRYFRYSCEHVMGFVDKDAVERSLLLVEEIGLKPEDRKVVVPARNAAKEKGINNKTDMCCGGAIELHDKTIVTGKNSSLMHAPSSVILNAIKTLAGIPDKIHLLSPTTIESIANMKTVISNSKAISLNVEETLIALSISATTNPTTQMAMEQLKDLKGCDMHLSHMPTTGDESGLRKLGVHLTCEPVFASENLFQ
jgi:uncharacterized protein (UPF0371 family)